MPIQLRSFLWEHRGPAGAVLGAGLMLLIGPGSYWSSRQAQVNQEVNQLAHTKQTAELRQQISDLLLRVVERSDLYMKLQECDPDNQDWKVHQKRGSTLGGSIAAAKRLHSSGSQLGAVGES